MASVNRALRQREWKTASATVATVSRNAIDPGAIDTSIASIAHATLLATGLLALHGVPRRMFSIETRIFGSIPKIGDTVMVTYPRFGLAGGEVFRIVALDLRLAESAMHLLLWG